MHNFKTLPKMINRITHFTLIIIILNKLFQKQGKVRKVGRALTGKKCNGPKKNFGKIFKFPGEKSNFLGRDFFRINYNFKYFFNLNTCNKIFIINV